MADRFKYSEVRQKIIDAIRIDLIGPKEEEEILEENPRYAYLVGMLDIQSDDEDYSGAGEQEVDADMAFEDGEDFTAGEDDDNEPISTTHFQLPSSIGISFYVQSDIESINLDVTWGDYEKSSEKYTGKDEKEHSRAIYKRRPMKETVHIQFKDFTRTKDYQLVCDSNIHVHISRIPLKGGYSLVTAYVINKRKNSVSSAEAIMFQVEINSFLPVRFVESPSKKRTLILISTGNQSRFTALIGIANFIDIKTTGCLFLFILLMKKYTPSARPLFYRQLINLHVFLGM